LFATPPIPVDRGVSGDAEQPGARVTTVETVDRSIGLQERVLCEVLCLRAGAGHAARHTSEEWKLGDDPVGEAALPLNVVDGSDRKDRTVRFDI
jgi:hypothetical protein